jgi:hypothetical protein
MYVKYDTFNEIDVVLHNLLNYRNLLKRKHIN